MPQAWVGCLACYNGGSLVGEWVEGTEAGEFVPCDKPGHEEWWVFDHEDYQGFLDGECSPSEAQALAEVIEAIEQEYYPPEAVAAWADNRGEKITAWDKPTREAFEDAYNGTWRTEEEFAEQLADDLGGVPDDNFLANYIDYEKLARDLFMGDYWSAAGGDGIFVYRNN